MAQEGPEEGWVVSEAVEVIFYSLSENLGKYPQNYHTSHVANIALNRKTPYIMLRL